MIQVNFWYGKANKPTKETDKVFIRVNNKSLNFRRSLGWDISLKDWDIKNKKLIDLNKNPKTNEEYQYLKQLQSKLQEVKDVFTDEYRKIAFEKPLTKIEFNDWCSINIKIAKGEDIEEGGEPLFVDLMEKCYKWKLKRKKIGESSVNQYKRHIKKIKDFEEYQIDENKKYKLDRGYYASELSLDFYDQLQDFYNKSKVDKDSPLNNNFKACIKKVKATVTKKPKDGFVLKRIDDDEVSIDTTPIDYIQSIRVQMALLSDDKRKELFTLNSSEIERAYLSIETKDVSLKQSYDTMVEMYA